VLVPFLGITAVGGTIMFGAYRGNSWLRFWEGLGETWLDSRVIASGPVPRTSLT
jgi:hypothetical protein